MKQTSLPAPALTTCTLATHVLVLEDHHLAKTHDAFGKCFVQELGGAGREWQSKGNSNSVGDMVALLALL